MKKVEKNLFDNFVLNILKFGDSFRQVFLFKDKSQNAEEDYSSAVFSSEVNVEYFKKIGILIIAFFIISKQGVANDQVTCIEEINNNTEIYSLLATVKNDILGTLPQFCRPDNYKQLSDQIDPGELALSEFVDKLKKINVNAPDTSEIDIKDEEATTKVIFDTLKMVILKKMWQQSSSENQYTLLVSEECSSLGLNRFPIYDDSNQSKNAKEKNKKSALQKTFDVCQSGEFADVAPYVSKDVLAEVLLNLKNIFPHSFPGMVDLLCADLSETNEIIFKDDKYDDFSRGDIAIGSARDFTAWLKSIYTDVSNKEEIEKKEMEEAAIIQKAAEKEYKEKVKKAEEEEEDAKKVHGKGEVAKGPYEQYEQYEQESAYIKMIKVLFEKHTKDGKVAEVKDDKQQHLNGYVITFAEGGYSIAPGKELMKKQEEDMAKQMAAYKEKSEKDTAVYIDKQKLLMQETYEKAVAEDKNLKEVEDPNATGFVIVKDTDGKYYYKPTEKMKEAIKEKKKHLDNQWKSAEYQKHYKDIYEAQNKTANANSQSFGFYGGGVGSSKILLTSDGLYKPESNNGILGNIQNEKYKKITSILSYEKNDGIAPGMGSGAAVFKLEDGSFAHDYLLESNHIQENIMGIEYSEEDSTNTEPKYKDPSLALQPYIVKKYQGKSSSSSKVKDLNSTEIAELQDYTGNSYRAINGCLRSENCTDKQKKSVQAMVSGLQKIKKSEKNKESYQIVYRGTSKLPKEISKILVKESDDFVLDKGFMSTTGEYSVAKSFAGGANSDGQVVFIMKTKSCVGISTISQYGSAEDEFLCPPGMKFKARKKEGSSNYYILEEVN